MNSLPWADTPESARVRALRLVLTVLLCADFTLNYIAVRMLYPLALYVAGTADVPYRVFPILLMHGAEKLHVLQAIARHMPTDDHSPDMLAVALMTFFGLLIAIGCAARTMQALGVGAKVANWAGLLVAFMSFFNFAQAWGLNYTVPYDVPALAFVAAGVWLLVSDRIAWFYPLFALATLNRETSCFLLIFYLAWAWIGIGQLDRAERTPARVRLFANLAALTAVWYVVKVVPTHMAHGHAFSTTGTGPILRRAFFNLKELFKPQQWPVLASTCGFTLPLVWASRRWIEHRRFATATAVVLALWFLGSLAQGLIIEIRIFGEWAAFITPLLGLIVYHRLQAMPSRTPTSTVPG